MLSGFRNQVKTAYFVKMFHEESITIKGFPVQDGTSRKRFDLVAGSCFPLENPKLVSRVKKELDLYLSDNINSWQLQSDGSYSQNRPVRGQRKRSAQERLLATLAIS